MHMHIIKQNNALKQVYEFNIFYFQQILLLRTRSRNNYINTYLMCFAPNDATCHERNSFLEFIFFGDCKFGPNAEDLRHSKIKKNQKLQRMIKMHKVDYNQFKI